MTLPGRSRRQLAGIEVALATDTALASMFAVFNALNQGEPASGPDPLPRSGWQRARQLAPGPWPSRIAALVVMGAVIVGGLLLSSALRPVARSCPTLTSPAARGAVALVGRGHLPLCRAYPANR